ncbi:MAG: DUF5011 domain-containing protein [Flavobacteriaceae bacterium]|nr:DUF5011 domain-containing protein [Flavobacteriaceae bacterium]
MNKIITLAFAAIAGICAQAQTIPFPLIKIDTAQYVNSGKLSVETTIPDYENPVFQNAKYADTIQIEGVVTFDPHYYGLSTTKSRISAFIQTTDSLGWNGIEVMFDTSFFGKGGNNPTKAALQNSTKFYDNFQVGLTVKVTGVLDNFTGGGNTKTGHTQMKILDYETVITNANTTTIKPIVTTIEQFMKNNGSGGQVWQPETGEKYEGVYVELRNVKVVDRSQSSLRWNWSLADNFGNKIKIRDYSVWMRNDKYCDCALPNGYTFAPPPTNSFLEHVRGIIVESVSSAGVAEYYLAPLEINDIGSINTYSPPLISFSGRSPKVPTSSQNVTISAKITDDTTVADASLYYSVNGGGFTMVSMASSGSNYAADIPMQANGSFVKFYIKAVDNSGFTSYANDTFGTGLDYMVIDNGITLISEIQQTNYSNGNSFWAGERLPMDIKAVVTATAVSSDDLGEVSIQQGTGLWSGILLRSNTGDGLNTLKRGDSILISSAYIRESFNFTYLDSLKGNYSVLSSGNALPGFVTPAFDSVANKIYQYTEPYEGMLVKWDNVFVTSQNPDAPSNFGEFLVNTDSASSSGFRVDDKSLDLGITFNKDSVALGQKLMYIQGVFGFANGQFKLWPRNRMDIDLALQPDKIAPIITMLGSWMDTVMENQHYNDPGATAFDNKDGDITSKIIRNGTVDSTKVGTYSLCYNVSDNAGNAANQACRNVYVKKNIGISTMFNMIQTAVKLYPNPAQNLLNIENQEKAIFILTDLNGKTINILGQLSTGIHAINIAELPSGLYLLQSQNEAGRAVVKFSVIK